MKTVAKVISRTILAITIIVFLAFAALMGPKLFGLQPYISTSGSMRPTVPEGALVYINVKDTKADVGDIVMFKIPNVKKSGGDKLVTHRIIGKEDDGFITKGDANEDRDANPVEQGQILGTYSYHIPQIGFIYDKIGQKGFILIAVWLIILNIVASIFVYIANESDKEKKQKKLEASIAAVAGSDFKETNSEQNKTEIEAERDSIFGDSESSEAQNPN